MTTIIELAKELGISRTAIEKKVKNLPADMVIRNGRNIQITEAGAELIRKTRTAWNEQENAKTSKPTCQLPKFANLPTSNQPTSWEPKKLENTGVSQESSQPGLDDSFPTASEHYEESVKSEKVSESFLNYQEDIINDLRMRLALAQEAEKSARDEIAAQRESRERSEEFFRKALEDKDKQMEKLMDRIADLTVTLNNTSESLKAAQTLQAMTIQKLEAPKQEDQDPEQEHKGLFSFFRRKNKESW